MPDNKSSPKITFDYFYGRESNQFNYYQVPQMLIKEPCFKNLSFGAKLLYGIMLNRMKLSQKNGWFAEDGRVYIIYTIAEITEDLNCNRETSMKYISELDDKKGIGLIERIRRGQGNPDIIFIKDFARLSENSTADFDSFYDEDVQLQEVGKTDLKKSEKPTPRSRKTQPQEVGKPELKKSENPTSRSPKNRPQEVGKPELLHYIKQDLKSITNQSIYQKAFSGDEIDGLRACVEEMIEGDIIRENFPNEYVDTIREVIVEAVMTPPGQAITVNKQKYDISVIQDRFRQLDREHVEYVLTCLEGTNPDVKNIKSYLTTALFNAPATMDSFYRLKVNHDLKV